MTNTKTYFENLDGLRAVAFLSVFFYHIFGYMNYSGNNAIENFLIEHVFLIGNLGVNLFFVLSGFLITYLLLKEKEEKGKVHIPHFYMRRVLRIWPLFYLVLFIGFFIYPALINAFNTQDLKEHLPMYLLFANNFDRIQTQFVGRGNDSLGVLWSIAVEEQFYLFWPLLIQFISKKRIPIVLLLIILFSLGFRSHFVENENFLYYHTFSVMSDLAIGALSAWLSLNHSGFLSGIKKLSRAKIVSVYLLFCLIFLSYKSRVNFNELSRVIERPMLAVFFAFIILEQCYAERSFYKFGALKLLSQLGLISYGLYCLHLFSIAFIQKINNSLGWLELNALQLYTELFICLGLSIGACYLSYRFYETKFLKLKNKFA